MSDIHVSIAQFAFGMGTVFIFGFVLHEALDFFTSHQKLLTILWGTGVIGLSSMVLAINLIFAEFPNPLTFASFMVCIVAAAFIGFSMSILLQWAISFYQAYKAQVMALPEDERPEWLKNYTGT